MTKVRHRSYGKYSGPQILGTSTLKFDLDSSSHWSRVLYLTSLVESGAKFGSITMYDGTAVTAGLHQAIAVYPKELAAEDFYAEDDQGSLWRLIRKLELVSDLPEYTSLSARLADNNWYVAQDGTLRYISDSKVKISGKNVSVDAGDQVFGAEIREEFTPRKGKVPASGPLWKQSSAWALLFHKLFSSPTTFDAQIEFGADHFLSMSSSRKIGSSTIHDLLYTGDSLSPSYDLALCVFWSHSVNAPSIAFRLLYSCLSSIPKPSENQDEFSRKLLSSLASSTYGRWHWSDKGGRWQRTRKFAKEMWDSALFVASGVMPYSL